MIEMGRNFVNRFKGKKTSEVASSVTEKKYYGTVYPTSYGVIEEWFKNEFATPELKDPDLYAQRLAERIEETFQIVGGLDLRQDEHLQWMYSGFPETMTRRDLRQKSDALEKRHKMLSSVGRTMDAMKGPDFLVGKLNGWLRDNKLDYDETTYSLLALYDHTNLETMHVIVERRTGSVYTNFGGENRQHSLVVFSRHYQEFKGDTIIEGYLDRLASGNLSEVASAIRAGNTLRQTSGPYSSGLGIVDSASVNQSPSGVESQS